MNLQSLIDRANRVSPMPWRPFQHPRPTKHSIAKINEHFRITLPHSLLEFVRCWRSSGTLFASLGADYGSPNHIIRINSYWRQRRRTRRIPGNLVVINQCHDEDCDCLDLARFDSTTGEYAIQYWFPGTTDEIVYSSFPEYMNVRLKDWEPSKKENAEQAAAPNRSATPSLNSGFPARGSEG